MQQRMKDLNCVDVSPPESPSIHSGDENRLMRRLLPRPDCDSGALSDSELSWRQHYLKDANSNHTKVIVLIRIHYIAIVQVITTEEARHRALKLLKYVPLLSTWLFEHAKLEVSHRSHYPPSPKTVSPFSPWG